jgi:hypothetical protein
MLARGAWGREATRRAHRAASTLRVVLGATALALPLGVAAHGGLSMEEDQCKLTLGPYVMHFAGYQPLANGNREFCEDIPQVGPTVVVMDMVDEALRALPVEVRIIRDTGEGGGNELGAGLAAGADKEVKNVGGNEKTPSNGQGSPLDAITLLHLPPKLYPAGSVPLEYNFLQPGRYVGLVFAGEKQQYVSRFPFSVGTPRTPYGSYLLMLLVPVAGFLLYGASGRARRAAEKARR